jgi:hypothetical protein
MNREAEVIGATLTLRPSCFPRKIAGRISYSKRKVEPRKRGNSCAPPPLRCGVARASGGMRIATVIGQAGTARQPVAATICGPSVRSPGVVVL